MKRLVIILALIIGLLLGINFYLSRKHEELLVNLAMANSDNMTDYICLKLNKVEDCSIKNISINANFDDWEKAIKGFWFWEKTVDLKDVTISGVWLRKDISPVKTPINIGDYKVMSNLYTGDFIIQNTSPVEFNVESKISPVITTVSFNKLISHHNYKPAFWYNIIKESIFSSNYNFNKRLLKYLFQYDIKGSFDVDNLEVNVSIAKDRYSFIANNIKAYGNTKALGGGKIKTDSHLFFNPVFKINGKNLLDTIDTPFENGKTVKEVYNELPDNMKEIRIEFINKYNIEVNTDNIVNSYSYLNEIRHGKFEDFLFSFNVSLGDSNARIEISFDDWQNSSYDYFPKIKRDDSITPEENMSRFMDELSNYITFNNLKVLFNIDIDPQFEEHIKNAVSEEEKKFYEEIKDSMDKILKTFKYIDNEGEYTVVIESPSMKNIELTKINGEKFLDALGILRNLSLIFKGLVVNQLEKQGYISVKKADKQTPNSAGEENTFKQQ